MPQADRITGIFKPFGGAQSPIAYVSAINGGVESMRRIALLDTGADCTFMSMKAAIALLGMKQSEIEKNKLPDSLTVGGKKVESFKVKSDLRLWHAQAGGDFLALRDATICVMPSLFRDFSVLIGQIDGFEEKVFRHENRSKNRVWQLYTP